VTIPGRKGRLGGAGRDGDADRAEQYCRRSECEFATDHSCPPQWMSLTGDPPTGSMDITARVGSASAMRQ